MKLLYQLTSPMERTLGSEEIARRREVLQRHAAPATEVSIASLARGPGAIESAYDAALVVPEIIEKLVEADRDGFDAAIIGCFSDPGMDAAREVTEMAIVGPGSSALHLAAQLGNRFSVISPGDNGGRAAARMRALGLNDKFASLRGIAMSVLELARDRPAALERIAAVGREAVGSDGADILVLGCMSMAFLEITEELQDRIGVPVVNPVVAAVKTAEMIAAMGLSHSKTAYPAPPLKEIFA
jgi:allantoin racemase